MRFRFVSIPASGAVLLLAVVGMALAAKPKAHYTYSTGTRSPSVYFQAASPSKLTNFTAGLALKCAPVKDCGGFGGVRGLSSRSVRVSKAGTFTVTGNITSVSNKKLGTEKVTGRFVNATTVTGKVTTHITLGPYKGVTKSYTATGAPIVG